MESFHLNRYDKMLFFYNKNVRQKNHHIPQSVKKMFN